MCIYRLVRVAECSVWLKNKVGLVPNIEAHVHEVDAGVGRDNGVRVGTVHFNRDDLLIAAVDMRSAYMRSLVRCAEKAILAKRKNVLRQEFIAGNSLIEDGRFRPVQHVNNCVALYFRDCIFTHVHYILCNIRFFTRDARSAHTSWPETLVSTRAGGHRTTVVLSIL